MSLFLVSCSEISGSDKRQIKDLGEKVLKVFTKEDNLNSKTNILISAEEYIKNIYWEVDAPQTLNPLPGKDFWRIHIGPHRKYAINIWQKELKGKNIVFEGLGDIDDIRYFSNYVFYKRVPIKYSFLNKRGEKQTEENDDILGVVVKYKNTGEFKVLNVFE